MYSQYIIDTIEEYTNSDGDISNIKPLHKIKLAQELLGFCIKLCEEAANEKKDAHAKAYIVDNLKIFLNSQHGFLDSSFNLEEWIDQIESDDKT